MDMVKGTTRRVILVKPPDRRLFEEAIFIMREDTAAAGVTADQVLQEAQQVADGYVRRNSACGKLLTNFTPLIFAALGAVLASAGWGVALFYFIKPF
jgi:hypothetical protein